MRCRQCGTEFEGNFCPECGARAEVKNFTEPPLSQEEQAQNQESEYYHKSIFSKETKSRRRNKKPIFLRWWFILFIIVVIAGVSESMRGRGDKIIWSDIELASIIPEPPSHRGDLYDNLADELWLDLDNISDSQYYDYIDACKEKGFTIEAKTNSCSYEAFNEEGYNLSISHYTDNLKIRLNAPMALESITWPIGTAGKLVPVPESTTGKFAYEYDRSFHVYVGETSLDKYNEYVTICANSGFTVNYEKGTTYYIADNAEGWHLSLSYEGNNIMSVCVDEPDDDAY